MLVRILIPAEVNVETLTADQLEGWDAEDLTVSREFGDTWIEEARTAVLKVPAPIIQWK